MLLLIGGALIAWTIFYYAWRFYRELELLPNIASRSVLITGCDTGFGHGTAFKCLEQGMTVFAACLTDDGVKTLRTLANTFPGTLHAFQMDVTKDESVRNAAAHVTKLLEGRGIDGIVNNAGVAGEFVWDEWQTVDAYRDVYEVNLIGVVRVTHAFRKLLKKAKGRIVNVSSSFATSAPAQIGPYACSKYGQWKSKAEALKSVAKAARLGGDSAS